MSSSSKDVKIAPGSVVCLEAKLKGQHSINIGSLTVIHPKASIIAEAGPVNIGENNIVEEQASIIHSNSDDAPVEAIPLNIGINNVFEVGCEVRAKSIGDHNVFEPKCYVGPNVEIGNGCIIGAGCQLTAPERLPDQTVITGQQCTRRVAVDKPPGSDDMVRQNDELTVMKEIFTKEEFNERKSGTETYTIFVAHPSLPVNFTLLLTKDSGKTEFKVNYLPPIRLTARLLSDYPSESCPEFTLSCSWLSRDKLSKLVEELEKLWSDNKCEILYIWSSFLKDQSLQFLSIFDSYDLIERCHIYFNHEGNRNSERCQRKEKASAGNADINKSRSSHNTPPNKFSRNYQHLNNEENGRSEGCQKQEKIPIQNVDPNKSWSNYEYSSSSSTNHLNFNHQVNQRSECKMKEKMSVENAGSNNSWSHYASSSKSTRTYHQSSRKSRNKKAYAFGIKPSDENEFLLKGKVKLDRKGLELLNSYRKEAVNQLYYDMIEHNAAKSREEFNRQLQDCNVCFSSVMGESCKKLSCGHVTCIDCLRRMFEVHTKHGTMECIVCSEEGCGLEIPLNLIQELLSKELFEKYDQLMLNKTLDKITNMTYCPRITCQYPVSTETEDSLAICPNCSNAFCIYCKRTYHGMEGCKMNTDEKRELIDSYQNGNYEKKLELEKRYGKKQLTELVNAAKSEMWMSENSKKCPCCHINIEKNDGCNKMICQKCNANFCWMCQKRLCSLNPYLHYQDPKSKCFNLLFEGIYIAAENDLDDDDVVDDFVDDDEYIEEDYLDDGVAFES